MGNFGLTQCRSVWEGRNDGRDRKQVIMSPGLSVTEPAFKLLSVECKGDRQGIFMPKATFYFLLFLGKV